MDYIKIARLWASYNNADLRDFFKSDFFKKYTNACIKKYELADDDNLAYSLRLCLSDDMQALGLIPLTALEDDYSEEQELEELRKFAKMYKF